MRTASRTNLQRLLSTVRRSSFGLYQMVLRAEFGSSVPLEKGSVKVDFTDLNDLNLRVRALCKQGQLKKALYTLGLLDEKHKVNSSTYICLFQVCILLKALAEGRQVHAHLIKGRTELNVFLEATLVDMYAKCGNIEDARKVFDKILQQNVVSWTAMIAGYAQNGEGEEALRLFCQMQRIGTVKPNEVTFASILNACTRLENLEAGKEVHVLIIKIGVKFNMFVGNALVNMYANCKNIEDAREVFEKMPDRDIKTWTAIIAGYVKNGLLQKSFQLLQQMECEGMKPSEVTFLSLLSACGISGNLDWGKQVHAHLIKTGIVLNTALGNTIIVMYSKHGSIGDAWHVYKKMDIRDVVSCNAMIAGYTEHGHGEEAFKLYQNMETECVKSNHVTFVSILKTCAILGNMDYGKRIHADITHCGLNLDVSVGNSLIDMYSKSGSSEDARQVFDKIVDRDVISWTTMIAGYSKNESPNEAIKLFWKMDEDAVKPNEVTCLSIISACSSIGNLEQGMKIHAQIVKIGFQLDAFVANALIDMYGKCGTIKDSCYLFDNLPTRDVISWNAIISGYSQHGYARETLLLVERMQQEGVKPNQITFIGILSACSRAGLVDEGCYYFHSMITDYKIFATSEHCACIVDLLGRVGHLDDAETFVEKMSVHCTAVVWRALLNACRIHGHADLGEHFVEKVLEFEPQNIAAVVMLSNIYAAAGRWEDQAEFVRLMKERV